MPIDRLSGTPPAAPIMRSGRKRGVAADDFRPDEAAAEAGAAEPGGSASPTAPTLPLDLILAVQGEDAGGASEGERRRRGIAWGEATLDVLEEAMRDMLNGVVPGRTLEALRGRLGEKRPAFVDSDLAETLDLIALRARVVLARLETEATAFDAALSEADSPEADSPEADSPENGPSGARRLSEARDFPAPDGR